MDLHDRWLLFKEQIKKELKPDEYEGWLDHLELVEVSAKNIIIAGITHPLFRDDIVGNYDELFRQLFNKYFPECASFRKKKIKYCVGAYHRDSQNPVQTEFSFEESPETFSENDSPDHSSSNFRKKTAQSHDSSGKIISFQSESFSENSLLFDSRQSLDALVVGNHNRLAYEAACRIIHEPGSLYSPFFIYGEYGLGKTHLLEAIGQAFQKLNPDFHVICITAESFLNEFVTHIQQRKMNGFRQRFRQADVLLVDDIQSLSGTKGCQEEMRHTIEALQKSKKQIVVTSNQLARNIQDLSPALCSQLESGLMVDVKLPDFETRMSILQSIAKRDHLILPPEICHFIGQHIFSNVRKMEGAVIRLGAHASLLRQKITLDFAQSTLADLLETPPHSKESSYDFVPASQIERIFQKICSMSQVSRSDLKSTGRSYRIARARQMSIYLLKELTDMSLKEIGTLFGNRTHSAIHNSIKQIKQKMGEDEVLRQQILLLKEELTQENEKSPIEIPPRLSEIKTLP
ncbi:MAG: chromosomal replication initiator protein DnaA [SAR324 cluster bacterium]|nr:chromosomal replication initiator protein DnaA [SAR324 cluster bacterium]